MFLAFWISTICNAYQVRDAKIRVFSSLKQNTDDDRSEWKKLADSLKVTVFNTVWYVYNLCNLFNYSLSLQLEYPNYTPLLSKILEGRVSQGNAEDKIRHYEEVIKMCARLFHPFYSLQLWLILIVLFDWNCYMFYQIISAATEVIESVNTDELSKYFSLKYDPEDEGAEVSF